ncbi:MAG: hypothetical protein O3A51_01435 [Verrucomicrobia bacterium]|nr:hypothetical protein [Verrucomicrobiota bacterium]
MSEIFTLNEMAAVLGKSPPFTRNLQSKLGLFVPSKSDGYTEAYVRFMRKVIALRTFTVPLEEIRELIQKEIKILELLNFDAIHESPVWFMCTVEPPAQSERHLLLSGHDLGFPLTSNAIQGNLDFRERDPELFGGQEMGEDVRRVLKLYYKLLQKVDARVQQEKPVLLEALDWAGGGLLP